MRDTSKQYLHRLPHGVHLPRVCHVLALGMTLAVGVGLCATVDAIAGDSVTTGLSDAAACGKSSQAALQILGSGGPLNADGRASTSYLIWLSHHPAIMVDLGPGSLVNLARAGANALDLDALLISHFHPDHVADLPALLWDADLLNRDRALLIAGPSGSGRFPDTKSFISRLVGGDGAFPFMQQVVGTESGFHLDVRVIGIEPTRRSPVASVLGARIAAYPVPHGKAPSLAYRIDGARFSVVFAGDQNGGDAGFARFAKDADVLVLHTAMSPQARESSAAKVIGLPQRLASLAAAAGAKRLVLSHLMALPDTGASAPDFSLANPGALLASVRSVYPREVSLAYDLQCIVLE